MGQYDLTTRDKVKAYEGITTSDDDALLEQIVEAVSTAFETYMQRKIKSWAYSYLTDLPNACLNGRDAYESQHLLSLPQYPIISVATVRINETAYSESTSISSSGWYIHDKNAGILGLRGYVWLDGFQNIELIYTAGYTAIPPEIEQAANEQVLMVYKRGKKEHTLGITSITHADGSMTNLAGNLLPSVKSVLDQYRRLTL